jgi:hypothetical protein
MSGSRRTRELNASEKGETYSRADEALWDDEYLLKLFNEQLENSTAVSEAARDDGVDRSVASSATETGTERDAESSSKTPSATSSGRHVETTKHITAKSAAGLAGVSGGFQLPEDIQALAQSFYNAGFEAGRYVGRTEAARQKSRKRHRE